MDEELAREALRQFIVDLEDDTVTRWRCSVPTFAKVELDGDVVIDCDVYFYDQAGSEPVSTDGLLLRLTPEA
jgi:hypothetical protein